MQEIAMSLLDIVQNSIKALATVIHIQMKDSQKENVIHIEVKDNGKGMDEETLKRVTDPFFTTRTTRKIGLGIPLLKENVETTGGYFHIESQLNQGTKLICEYVKNHIDTPMMGDLVETLITLIQGHENIQFIFEYVCDDFEFVLNTQDINDILEDVSIQEPAVILWLKEYIKEGLRK